MALRLAIWVCAAFVAFKCAQAQSNSGCECVGLPCDEQSIDGGGVEVSSQDCVKVPRPDCPCCLVCALNEGQNCDDLTKPCDLTQGLFCNSTSNLCEKGKHEKKKDCFYRNRQQP